MRYGLSDTTIAALQAVFRKYLNIDKVLIFGSRAMGTYRAGSDIDLAVVGKDITFRQMLDISNDIDDQNLLYKVDLVDYQKNLGTPIGDHISRVGLVFYQAA